MFINSINKQLNAVIIALKLNMFNILEEKMNQNCMYILMYNYGI